MPRKPKQQELEKWLRDYNVVVYDIKYPNFINTVIVMADNIPQADEFMATNYAGQNYELIRQISKINICQPPTKTS